MLRQTRGRAEDETKAQPISKTEHPCPINFLALPRTILCAATSTGITSVVVCVIKRKNRLNMSLLRMRSLLMRRWPPSALNLATVIGQRQSSFAVSSFDALSESSKIQASSLRASVTPAGFKQDDASTAWACYTAMKVEERAQGSDAKRKQLAFLAIAFRELSCNKNSNFMSLDQFRRQLSFALTPTTAAQACFAEMRPDADGKIRLDQWLDHLPTAIVQTLHAHPEAEKWRMKAKYTERDSLKARRLRGSPYV